MYQKGNKLWELPKTDAHPESVTFKLVKVLDRGSWGLEDIHEAGQLIQQEPIIKEVVLSLLELINKED
ncbi:hypothetical protein LCGC14_0845890 [marine sediment metagenome]|uniref:Uncharacterized protein n=1 Tax=marine sediment metagenome TaxID=412755 RepID=A0A0F9SIY8_9ZZZZ